MRFPVLLGVRKMLHKAQSHLLSLSLSPWFNNPKDCLEKSSCENRNTAEWLSYPLPEYTVSEGRYKNLRAAKEMNSQTLLTVSFL